MPGSSAHALHRVFVYGTLLPGERNAHVCSAGITRTRATVTGYALFHLEPEGYPVLLPDAHAAPVHGWVYTYTPEAWPQALPALDALDGVDRVPPLYTRERATARCATGEDVDAWVYIYARAARTRRAGALRVPGGDWTRRDVLDTPGANS